MNDFRTDLSVTKEALIRDANILLADIQALLKDVADEAGTEASQARDELVRRMCDLRARLGTFRDFGSEGIGHFVKSTDSYVHEHPWQCLGMVATIGAATGAVMALALGRR